MRLGIWWNALLCSISLKVFWRYVDRPVLTNIMKDMEEKSDTATLTLLGAYFKFYIVFRIENVIEL